MSEPVKDPNELPAGAPDDPLTGHDYDGIQEYDNPLPGWWKWLFIASILFTPPYFFFYHNGAEGRSLADRYDRELAANLQLQFKEIGNLTGTREEVVKFLYSESFLTIGKAVFKSNCVSCHGNDGGGVVGPNLCDEEYKNVQDIGDILKVIQNGASAGAMPAWKNRLTTNEIVMVSSYAASLRGTNPASGKAAEGRPAPPWPEPPPEEVEEAEEATEEAEEEAGTPATETEGENSDSGGNVEAVDENDSTS